MNDQVLRQWGQLVRQHRGGMSQRTLAEKVDVDQTTISKVELGRIDPSGDLKVRIARALAVPIADLFPYPEVEAAAAS
jgi:DNA-binding XRE family transcriptional regulator